MTLREAAQQALEALEEYQSKGAPFWACDSAVAALRAALNQPPVKSYCGGKPNYVIPESFDKWWNSDFEPEDNPFDENCPGYWAWEGWKAARSK